MFEDKFEIIELIDTYGTLLTESMLEILLDYYTGDISLGEIAENKQISRQAVHDSISRSLAKLRKYEETLKIISKQKRLKSVLDEMLSEKGISAGNYNKLTEILEE